LSVTLSSYFDALNSHYDYQFANFFRQFFFYAPNSELIPNLFIFLFRFLGDSERSTSDMARAAQLGSKFAQQQCVASNPYAAMCNAVVTELLLPYAKAKSQENAL
jgi:hypothetical protein